MKRYLLIVLSFSILSFPAVSAEVSMKIEKQKPVISFNPEGKGFAVFQRFNDIWLVFNSKIKKALPASLLAEPEIGLISQEKLVVSNGGSGMRLSFKTSQPFYIEQNKDNYTLRIGKQKTTTNKAILNIISLKEGIRLSGKNANNFLKSTSLQTGEVYTVMPMDILNSQPNERVFYPIKLLKTISGRVFTTANGENIKITPKDNEYLIFTTATEKINIDKYTGNRAVLNEIEKGVPVEFRDPEFMDMFATGIDGTTNNAEKTFAGTLSLLTEAVNKIDALPTPKNGKPLYNKKKILDAIEARINKGKIKALTRKSPVALPDADVLLPRYTKVGENDFRRFEIKFLKRLRGIKTEKELNKGRLQLAKLAFAFKRYAEAGALLKEIPQEDQDKSILAQTKILMGASLILTNRAKEAIPLLKEGKYLVADRLTWLAMAYEKTGQIEKAGKLFKENIDASRAYPPHLQVAIRLSQARVLLKQKKIKQLEKRIFDLERLVPDGKIPAEAKLLLAQGYMLKEKYEEGEKLLSEVAQSDNPEAAFTAQYEFVTYLFDNGQLTKERVLDHLEDLRFLWRGGQLEQDILYRLGNIYLNDEEYRKGLERFKYYTIYFSDSPRIAKIAEKMTSAFNDLFFSEKALKEKDTLEILGLYYDFRELTPPGEKGDQLIAKIGANLRSLGLFTRAAKLLKHQLDFRTKSSLEKAKLGKQLAELYLLNLKYKKALKVLDKTESKHIPNEIVQERTLLRSRILMAKGDIVKAHDIIISMAGKKAQKMKADIAWEEKKYKEFIKISKKILTMQSSPEKWEPEDHTNFARLVFAYGATKNIQAIKDLEKKYPIYTAKKDIQRIFTFLKQDKENVDVSSYLNEKSNWANLIRNIAVYNNFSEQYNNYVSERKKEKKFRKVFNKRMGQPSAPSRLYSN